MASRPTMSHLRGQTCHTSKAKHVVPPRPSVSHLCSEQQWSYTVVASRNPLAPHSLTLSHLPGQHCRTSTTNNNNPLILYTPPRTSLASYIVSLDLTFFPVSCSQLSFSFSLSLLIFL
ncbi:hypothetical protein AAZX31_16G052300 [Glycine max]